MPHEYGALIPELRDTLTRQRYNRVVVQSETGELIDAAKREFASAAEVQRCYYVTEEADFVLVIMVPTMADYQALTRRLFFSNTNVKRFPTFVAVDSVKVGLSVPLPG